MWTMCVNERCRSFADKRGSNLEPLSSVGVIYDCVVPDNKWINRVTYLSIITIWIGMRNIGGIGDNGSRQ